MRWAYSLDTALAAFRVRENEVIAQHQRSYAAGVAASDSVILHAESRVPAEYREELRLAVASQRLAFREHDAIRNEEATIQRQGWQRHEALQQWHKAEAEQFTNEQAELIGRAAHFESTALAAVQERDLGWRGFSEAHGRL